MPLGETLLVLGLYVLVAARLTRMVNYDTVGDPIRLWIARRASTAHLQAGTSDTTDDAVMWGRRSRRWNGLADFLSCPWCVGLWISAALAPAAIHVIGWPWWTWAVLPFAASHLVGAFDRFVADPVAVVEDE